MESGRLSARPGLLLGCAMLLLVMDVSHVLIVGGATTYL